MAETKSSTYSPSAYLSVFGSPPSALYGVIEGRIAHKTTDDFLDDLISSSRPSVHAWMVRKAKLADGTLPGLPVLSLPLVQNQMNPIRHQTWLIKRGRTERDAWPIALAGLGRDLCGASLADLARRLNISLTTASNMCNLHRHMTAEQGDYSLRVAAITHAALRTWRSV